MTDAEVAPEVVEAFKRAVLEGDVVVLRSLFADHDELRRVIDAPLFPFDSPAVVQANKHRPVLEVLLDYGADVNRRSEWWAGSFGVLDGCDPETAEFLISRGAVVDAHAAAGLGKMDRLQQLMEEDPSLVHATGGDGQRPLHFARSRPVVDFLLAHGADLEARDVDHGSTAAQWMLGDRPRLCRYLLERGARPDVFMVCVLGDGDLAERLLADDTGAQSEGVLGHRIGEGDFVSPDSEAGHIYTYTLGYTSRPLMVAAARGHEALVEALLEGACRRERFLFACWQGDHATARELFAEQPALLDELPRRDQALICDAAWENRLEAVKVMLDVGFDPRTQGVDDSTPLDRASLHGFRELVELLLQHDPPMSQKNAHGGTPLEACLWGSLHGWRTDGDYPGTVEALLRAGAPRPETAVGSAEAQAVLVRFGVPRAG